MTFPINIKFGSAEISSHLVFELLAYTLGFRYFLKLRKNTVDAISSEHRVLILIAAAIGAILGSRVLGYFETPAFFKGEFSFMVLYSSKTVLGGLLGGLIGVELCKKIIGVTVSSGDLLTYPLLLGMIIGRIGCFLAGLEDGTHGIATTLPWGIDFGDGVYRHPTNLYEIIFLALAWGFIFVMEKRFELTNGSKFKLFLFSYCLFRFLAEFIKPVQTFSFGFSAIQLAALLGVLYYYKLILNPASLIAKRKYA
ncbi:MAG TPA: prolipoprotein diacylglyceryl transferase family protein [Flavobacteriales bacterium]|nr:prolipoprotein diacylglyceryl transferase family protein [Flavobacteriales bacterium]